MKTIALICKNCKKPFERPIKEYNRGIKLGKTKFYCSQSCSTTHTRTIHKTINRNCLCCGNLFESSTHKNHKKCCSHVCSRRQSQSFVDVLKISSSMIKFYEKHPERKNPKKECFICKSMFFGRTKFCSKKCSLKNRGIHLKGYEKFRKDCQFKFSLSSYPKEFDFDMIEKYGWYSAKNKGDNPNGVSRDHIISVRWAFDNGVDSKWISHPANCQLLRHSDNVSKGKKESISIELLLEKIQKWDKKYLGL